jgi:hypothetical protein
VFNYADAMQYYGITDGIIDIKVYDQVSSYLVDLNHVVLMKHVKMVLFLMKM